jgi:hypothetical protein
MFEKIEELDQDYDCILLHVFTNNLRNGTPEQIFILKQNITLYNFIIQLLFSHYKERQRQDNFGKLAMTGKS